MVLESLESDDHEANIIKNTRHSTCPIPPTDGMDNDDFRDIGENILLKTMKAVVVSRQEEIILISHNLK